MQLPPLDLVEKTCHIGHPFSPTGRGEDIRCTHRALRSVGVPTRLMDLYGLDARDDHDLCSEFEPSLIREPSELINVFHLNGDEVEQALSHIGGLPKHAVNVVYPAWELPLYPPAWARQLEQFDEIWASTRHTATALASAVSRPVKIMPLACEKQMRRFYSRRHFGIPETAFAFLFFFDFTSFIARKNPFGVLEAFAAAYTECRDPNLLLVLKINRGTLAPADYASFLHAVESRPEPILLLDQKYTNDEMANLVRNCDVFVSLHRAEGFGRGLAEAMYFGKPVIATGWSGNMDFMNPEISCLVDYHLIPVGAGEYPFFENQVWAEAHIDDATQWMTRTASSRAWARDLGARASRQLRTLFSYRARGIEYVKRISTLIESSCGTSDVGLEETDVRRSEL